MNEPLYVATDVIIEYSSNGVDGFVLIDRYNPAGKKAIPGGILEPYTTTEENARKETWEEIGLEISTPKLFGIYSQPSRDPRARIVSVVYTAKARGIIRSGSDAKAAKFYTIDDVVDMLGKNQFAFDHEQILTDYLVMKGHISHQIINVEVKKW